ncbi:MAG TPA: gamma carbonic anhydrase family protein [Casimicrobiaceae bacterium]
MPPAIDGNVGVTMQLRYLLHAPALAAPSTLAPRAVVAGRVSAGPGLVMRDHATLRADGEAVRVGSNGFFGVRATVHIADSLFLAIIGDDVSVGRYGLVHACTLGDGVAVADAATVMDGAVVGDHALLMPGAVVPPRKALAGGIVYAGSPAVALRAIAREELALWHAALRAEHSLQPAPRTDLPAPEAALSTHPPCGARSATSFVAATARIAGQVELADDASLYFACVADAGDARIALGARSNVQDNTFLAASRARGDLLIGDDVTVGHNVRMGSGTVGHRALIGMAAIVGDGVIVEDGACIGAGAHVEPGTRVPSGWIYAGRPARPFRELKPAEREGFADIVAVYAHYSEAYRTA